MPEKSESEYEKQERWRTDVRTFVFALFKHWLWWLSATIGSGLAALCAAWMHGLSGGGKVIPFWVYVTAAATGLVVASFRAFCGQRRIAEAKEAELENAVTKHAEEKRRLEEKIQTLSNTKENEEKVAFLKKSIKEIMSYQLANLENRISEIAQMTSSDYTGSLKDGRDVETAELLDKISKFLNEHIAPGTSILFTSKSGVSYSQITHSMDATPEQKKECEEHITTIDHLKHFTAQLKEIIKNYK